MPSQAELTAALEDRLKSARNTMRAILVMNLEFYALRKKIEQTIRDRLGPELAPDFRWPPNDPGYAQNPQKHTGKLVIVFPTREATNQAFAKLHGLSFGGRNARVMKAGRVAVST